MYREKAIYSYMVLSTNRWLSLLVERRLTVYH